MADHADHAGIDQPLGNLGAHFRVALVIFRYQLETDFPAADFHPGGIDVVDRQPGTLLDILAQMRNRAGQRRSLANANDLGPVVPRLAGRRLCLLSAPASKQHCRRHGPQFRHFSHRVLLVVCGIPPCVRRPDRCPAAIHGLVDPGTAYPAAAVCMKPYRSFGSSGAGTRSMTEPMFLSRARSCR